MPPPPPPPSSSSSSRTRSDEGLTRSGDDADDREDGDDDDDDDDNAGRGAEVISNANGNCVRVCVSGSRNAPPVAKFYVSSSSDDDDEEGFDPKALDTIREEDDNVLSPPPAAGAGAQPKGDDLGDGGGKGEPLVMGESEDSGIWSPSPSKEFSASARAGENKAQSIHARPTTNGGMQNGSSVGIHTQCIHTPFCTFGTDL